MSRIIIVHYHLNPGGVTRIIESQVQALLSLDLPPEITVFTGYCENPDYYLDRGVELIIEERLNYLPQDANLDNWYHELKNAFTRILTPGDILHIHNLNLGKNPLLTYVVSVLSSDGYRVVNHAHDFAEDRPLNYTFLEDTIRKFSESDIKDILYPNNSGVVHASLNSLDLERLRSYGVPENRSFILPNPVVVSPPDDPKNQGNAKARICATLAIPFDKKIITYPVRVIRRKNIGEYILLASLFQEEASWLVTQPPKNPVEKVPYEEWKKFCSEEDIRVVFGAGEKVDFEDIINGSDLCFTTSIQEGFGMAYMEPWLMGTPVGGRSLENIIPDLEHSGMIFPLLYDTIKVLIKDQPVDFGSLDMLKQMKYIQSIKRDEKVQKEFRYHNAIVNNLLNSIDQSIIAQNREVILKEYSLSNYAQQIQSIYKRIT